MSSEQPQPFNVGDEVEHKCGIVGIVKACERRVVHGSTRWVVDIDAGNGEKIVQAWPHNCKLIKAAQTIPVRETESDVAEAVDNLLVANLSSALVRALKFHAGGDEALRAEFARIIREDLAEHRPTGFVRVESDLREQLEEATAEFARALSAAHEQANKANEEAEEYSADAERWRRVSNDWRSVVVECENILGMNGDTPTDPKTSAVPMRVRKLIDAVEAAKSRRDKVIALLQGVE